MDQIEEVKAKIDIGDLVGEYVQLKKAGRNLKGLCPFHGEKTPSFMVNTELQIYKCFGCNAGGDAISFLQKMEGMEFGEALQALAKRVGVTLTSYRPSGLEEQKERLVKTNTLVGETYHYLLTKHEVGKKAREYLKQRGILDTEVERFVLGFAPGGWDFLVKFLGEKKKLKMDEVERGGLVIRSQNDTGRTRWYDRFRERIIFPLKNARGHVVGFSGRLLPGADEKAGGKYINSPETEIYHKGDLLYGLDITRGEIKQKGWAVVVEGEIDAIASYQAGIKNVVAIKGSALTGAQVELLRRICERVVLGLDADLAGNLAARRGIEIAEKGGLFVETVNWTMVGEGKKDAADVAIENPEKWREMVENAISVYSFYIDVAIRKYGLSPEGKVRIMREVLPFLAMIEDPIRRDEYLKELARKVQIDMDVVRSQLKKLRGEGGEEMKGVEKEEEKMPRRERLEEYVMGLAIRSGKGERLLEEGVRALITVGFWKRVVDEIERGGKGTDTKTWIDGLAAELKERVKDLVMVEEELVGGEWEKEWEKAVGKLEEINIRETIGRMQKSKTIDANQEEIVRMGNRLSELTKGR